LGKRHRQGGATPVTRGRGLLAALAGGGGREGVSLIVVARSRRFPMRGSVIRAATWYLAVHFAVAMIGWLEALTLLYPGFQLGGVEYVVRDIACWTFPLAIALPLAGSAMIVASWWAGREFLYLGIADFALSVLHLIACLPAVS
jgi:hypothetical protein